MDRGRNGGFVTDNNYFAIKLKKKKRDEHLRRLKKIKERPAGSSTTLDNTPPNVIAAASVNPRKISVKKNFSDVVERENKSLLKRITFILTAPPKITDQQYQDMKKLIQASSTDTTKESFEKKMLDGQNRRFFENLQRIKPVYQTKQWEEDYKRQLYNQRFMRQVHYRRSAEHANNKDISASSSLTSDDNLRKMSPKPESLLVPLQGVSEDPEQEKKNKSSAHIDRIRAYKQVLAERQAQMRQRQQQSMLIQRQRSSRLASLDPSATHAHDDDNDDDNINGFEPPSKHTTEEDDNKSQVSSHSSSKKSLNSGHKQHAKTSAKHASGNKHGGKSSNIAFSVFTGDDQYDHDGFFNEDDFHSKYEQEDEDNDNETTFNDIGDLEGQKKMNIASIERQIKIIHEVMDIGNVNPLAALTPHTGNKAGFLEQISYLDGTVECCLYPEHVVVLTVTTTAPYHANSNNSNTVHHHGKNSHKHQQQQQKLQVEAEITTADLLMMTGDTVLDPSDMSMLTSIAQEIVENVELRVDFNEAPKIVLNLLHENNILTQPSSPHAAREGSGSPFGSIDAYDVNNVDLEAVLLLQQSQASEYEVEDILLPDLQNNSLILVTTTRIPVAITNVLSHGNTGFSLANLNRVIDAAKQAAKVEYVMAMLQIRSLNSDQVSVHAMTVTSTKKMFIKRSPVAAAHTPTGGSGKGSNISNMLLSHAPSHHQGLPHAAVPANSYLTFASSLPSVAQLDPELIVEFAENLAKNLRIDHDSKSGKNTLALNNPADAIIKDR